MVVGLKSYTSLAIRTRARTSQTDRANNELHQQNQFSFEIPDTADTADI